MSKLGLSLATCQSNISKSFRIDLFFADCKGLGFRTLTAVWVSRSEDLAVSSFWELAAAKIVISN